MLPPPRYRRRFTFAAPRRFRSPLAVAAFRLMIFFITPCLFIATLRHAAIFAD